MRDMMRESLISKHQPDPAFRWRSHEIARIEGFSDAVFGFALTLLIVSLEVPHTSTELLETMAGFGSFVATFVILASIWYSQYLFFRRYGLEDATTVVLNLALLFTVLFFAYPLKFLFGLLLKNVVPIHSAHPPVVLAEHRPLINFIFGAGFIAVFAVFVLLYRHAWKKREELGLNEYEEFETKHTIRRLLWAMLVGSTYFLLGALMMLPRSTPAQKKLFVRLDLALGIVMIALMLRLILLNRERRVRRKAWLAQQTDHTIEG